MRLFLHRCGLLSRSQASALFRLMLGDETRAEALALPEPWRGMAVRLAGAGLDDRPTVWDWLVDGLGHHEKIALFDSLDRVEGAAATLEAIRKRAGSARRTPDASR